MRDDRDIVTIKCVHVAEADQWKSDFFLLQTTVYTHDDELVVGI